MRPLWTGLLALDNRLGDAARPGRDAIMIQLRLAWWRDRLAEPAANWPRGEPLLGLLTAWDAERPALAALVDGVEAQGIGEDGGAALDDARAGAIVALARLAHVPETDAIRAAAANWAKGLPPGTGLPRALRPLLLLHHFATATDSQPWRIMLGAMRKGWFGR